MCAPPPPHNPRSEILFTQLTLFSLVIPPSPPQFNRLEEAAAKMAGTFPTPPKAATKDITVCFNLNDKNGQAPFCQDPKQVFGKTDLGGVTYAYWNWDTQTGPGKFSCCGAGSWGASTLPSKVSAGTTSRAALFKSTSEERR